MSDRGPSHELVIVDKQNKKHKTRAGVLFPGQYGFSLRLNPGVVLSSADAERYWLNVYEIRERRGAGGSAPPRDAGGDGGDDFDDDDVPF